MVLAYDTDSPRTPLAIAEEKVPFHPAPVAMPQREHPAALAKRVEPVNIFAGLVGDDFIFTVTLLEEISFHHCGRVRHRLMAVPDTDGFSAIPAQWRAPSEVIVVDAVMVWLALHFHLQRRVN